ncbi:thiolase family protein [Herbiconiux sp.]|uniref:thiolase family protein n=1 Tax=Herbiconiux sp. TaxID=1871186 RepID=UPI0025C3D6EB|nr:thiolase family protein [Herbiconiux sp.]
MSDSVVIAGAAETPYTRHPEPRVTTAGLLVRAAREAVAAAGLRWSDVDGLGVSSFTLGPDHAVDLAWRAGLGPLRWLMEDTNGGASALNMLQHAELAIRSGQASTIVLVSGDRMDAAAFRMLVEHYNRSTEDHLVPLPATGPNALFALLTQRQMTALGLTRRDYGRIATAQREWAGRNPGAVYRTPLTLEEYLDAPLVAPPLGRYDCVPPVSGADAVVLTAAGPPGAEGGRAVRVLAVETTTGIDDQDGDGLTTGLVQAAPRAWERAGLGASDMHVFSVYDDYPAMALAQLIDLGAIAAPDAARDLAERIGTRRLPVNTAGGQLSAGQAGAAAGMHGVVETYRQLAGIAGERQVPDARFGVVTGYGMVLYRYGSCANVAVLEAVR